jgi:hypothetical protein
MLELGKYYLQRDGFVVGPLEVHKSSSIGFEDYVFKASDNRSHSFGVRIWKADGSFHIVGSKSPYDLISEVEFKLLTEQPKEEIMSESLKLEVGKYYEDRAGTTHGPIEAVNSDVYPFGSPEDCFVWTEEGKYYPSGESVYDLIKEVPNPNQESETMSEQPAQAEPISKFKEISFTEALEVLKTGQSIFVTLPDQAQVEVNKNNRIAWLFNATKFEIEVKPVVKYRVVYSDNRSACGISSKYYETVEDFYSDYDQTQYHCAELIQFARKEF